MRHRGRRTPRRRRPLYPSVGVVLASPSPMPTLSLPTQQLTRRAAPVISGLAEAVIAAEVGRGEHSSPEHIRKTGEVLLQRISQMPPHLSFGMMVLVLSFNRFCRARAGQAVAELSNDERLQMLGLWKTSPIGPLRQFVQFYEKMGSFVYYSCVEEDLMPPVEVR